MPDGFSANEAKYALQIAALPYEYEKAQIKKIPDKDLKQVIINIAPQDTKDNLQVIQISNTTCVMAYNPQNHSVSIAFEQTLEFGDTWDDIRAIPARNHSLGGEVHRGNYSDLVNDHDNKALPGDNMIDVIGTILYDYESKQDKPLSRAS